MLFIFYNAVLDFEVQQCQAFCCAILIKLPVAFWVFCYSIQIFNDSQLW
jgi:hypothetical protein